MCLCGKEEIPVPGICRAACSDEGASPGLENKVKGNLQMPEDHWEMCCVTLVRPIGLPDPPSTLPGLDSTCCPGPEQSWGCLRFGIFWPAWPNELTITVCDSGFLTLQATRMHTLRGHFHWGRHFHPAAKKTTRLWSYTLIRNWVGLAGELTWLSIFASLVFRKWTLHWTLQWLLGERRCHLPHDGPYGSHPDWAGWRSAAER